MNRFLLSSACAFARTRTSPYHFPFLNNYNPQQHNWTLFHTYAMHKLLYKLGAANHLLQIKPKKKEKILVDFTKIRQSKTSTAMFGYGSILDAFTLEGLI